MFFRNNVFLALVIHQVYHFRVDSSTIVSNRLLSILKTATTTNILITMEEDSIPLLKPIVLSGRSYKRETRLQAVVDTLQGKARRSQRKVVSTIVKMKKKEKKERKRTTESLDYQVLWISNQMIVRGADVKLVEKLAKLENVIEISPETFIRLESSHSDKHKRNQSLHPNPNSLTWGVNRLQAPLVWADGQKGANVTIGIVDTGVRHTHQAIRENYVGPSNYGWYDPAQRTTVPSDEHGHGTHCIGTIVGRHGIGVAPEAQWMACKGCEGALCSSFHLIECLQFMACPTDPNGRNPDCSKAPHILSNSWGGGRNLAYARATRALQDAGIITIFAAGNRGPGCRTVTSPADYETVIAVGATNRLDEVSGFSASGPTWENHLKPDIVAPGTEILSASHLSDRSYTALDGTSMACPHVAGVVALMMSKSRDLSPSQVKSILHRSTHPAQVSRYCGDLNSTNPPNHRAGYGLINAKKAVDNMHYFLP